MYYVVSGWSKFKVDTKGGKWISIIKFFTIIIGQLNRWNQCQIVRYYESLEDEENKSSSLQFFYRISSKQKTKIKQEHWTPEAISFHG